MNNARTYFYGSLVILLLLLLYPILIINNINVVFVEYLLFLFINIVFYFLFLFNFSKTNNLFEYINLFGMFFYLYVISIYINKIFFNNTQFEFNDSVYLLSILGCIYYIVFSLAYNLGIHIKSVKTIKIKQENKTTNTWINFCLWIVFIIGLLLEMKVLSMTGGIKFFLVSRAARMLLLQKVGLYALFTEICAFVSIACFFVYVKYDDSNAKLLFFISIIHNILYAVLTVSRSDFALQLIPIIYILLDYKKISNKKVVFISFLTLVLFGVWKQLIPMIIFKTKFTLSTVGMSSELESWYSIGKDILFNLEGVIIYGRSYLDSFLGLIFPLYDFEPLSLWYIRNYYNHIYEIGGGRGFSTIIEAIMNFGYAGIVIVSVVYGLFFSRLYVNKNNSDFAYLAYILSLSFIYKMFRSEIFAVLKVYVWVYILLSFLIFVVVNNLTRRTINQGVEQNQ